MLISTLGLDDMVNVPSLKSYTLELDVLDDFNPREIDWRKVLDMQEIEECRCYIEDVDLPLNYYN